MENNDKVNGGVNEEGDQGDVSWNRTKQHKKINDNLTKVQGIKQLKGHLFGLPNGKLYKILHKRRKSLVWIDFM